MRRFNILENWLMMGFLLRSLRIDGIDYEEEILKIGRKKYLSHGKIIVTICVWIV